MLSTNPDEVVIPAFDLVAFMQEKERLFGLDVPNVVSFALIFLCIAYIYNKVFRTRRLPLLKNAIVYGLLACGAFMLLVFQVDAGLPMVYSLLVAVLLMLVVRIRYYIEGRRQKRSET